MIKQSAGNSYPCLTLMISPIFKCYHRSKAKVPSRPKSEFSVLFSFDSFLGLKYFLTMQKLNWCAIFCLRVSMPISIAVLPTNWKTSKVVETVYYVVSDRCCTKLLKSKSKRTIVSKSKRTVSISRQIPDQVFKKNRLQISLLTLGYFLIEAKLEVAQAD
jgi:hypothetical protein